MPMMTMLIICVVIYFSMLITILLYHKYMKPEVTNLIFIIVNTVLFIGYNINDYYRHGTFIPLTFDQISPFTFTMLPLSYLMNDKIKSYFFSAVSFLSVGMFIAMLVSPQEAYLSSNRVEATMLYVLDTLEHLNCSLFGIYLITSGQIKLNRECLKKAFIFMYSVIGFVVCCNFLFHTNYFGMGPFSNFGIYMFRLFDSYWANLLAYLLGVALVLSIGFEFNYILKKLNTQKVATKEEIEESKIA